MAKAKKKEEDRSGVAVEVLITHGEECVCLPLGEFEKLGQIAMAMTGLLGPGAYPSAAGRPMKWPAMPKARQKPQVFLAPVQVPAPGGGEEPKN